MTAAASPPTTSAALTTSAASTTSAWALAGRFARFISGLREAVATGSAHNAALMNIAARLWNRLTEAAERFAAIAAHPVARTRRSAAPARAPEDAMPADPVPAPTMPARPAPPRRTLPRGFGWLARMAPETVPSGIEFTYLLAQPELAALLATSPRLWHVLRPLCRMFGVTPSETLPQPPPSPPRRAPAPRPNLARLRRRSEAAAIREHGPRGYRPSLFGR